MHTIFIAVLSFLKKTNVLLFHQKSYYGMSHKSKYSKSWAYESICRPYENIDILVCIVVVVKKKWYLFTYILFMFINLAQIGNEFDYLHWGIFVAVPIFTVFYAFLSCNAHIPYNNQFYDHELVFAINVARKFEVKIFCHA